MKPLSALEKHKSAYDQLFQGAGIKESLSHYYWVLQKCLKVAPRSTLMQDVGCGKGIFLAIAEKKFQFCYGLDLSEAALKRARLEAPHSYLVCAAGEDLPFPDESYDLIVNVGSLEHFLDLPRAVKEMARVLKKYGHALILVPNSFFLPIILNVLLKGDRGLKSIQPREIQATREEWRQLFSENGLNIINIFSYNYRTPQDPWLYRIMRPFIPFNFSYCFLFHAIK